MIAKIVSIKLFTSLNYFRYLLGLSLLIIVAFLGLANASDKELRISDERGQLTTDMNLEDWSYHRKIMGLPHVFLKPTKNKKHSSMSITFSGHKTLMEKKVLKKKTDEYTQGRKQWAKKRKAVKIKKFYPYKYIETENKIKIHILGFEYSTAYLKSIKENSIYLNCPDDSLIHIKIFLLPEHFKFESKLINFVKSIKSCKRHQT